MNTKSTALRLAEYLELPHIGQNKSAAELRRLHEENQALRQALAESTNSAMDFVEPKAPSQTEQEPVKEPFNSKEGVKEAFTLDRGCWERGCMAYDERDGDAVNISAEPFIYVREDNERPFGGYEHCSEADAGAFPVYTAPPKREWVGLTHEERDEIDQTCRSQMEALFAIEAKLKEKNT